MTTTRKNRRALAPPGLLAGLATSFDRATAGTPALAPARTPAHAISGATARTTPRTPARMPTLEAARATAGTTALAAALTSLAAALTAVPASVHAAPALSVVDLSFYTAPAIGAAARGDLLRHRPATVNLGAGAPAVPAWNVLYRSTDALGQPNVVSGTGRRPAPPGPAPACARCSAMPSAPMAWPRAARLPCRWPRAVTMKAPRGRGRPGHPVPGADPPQHAGQRQWPGGHGAGQIQLRVRDALPLHEPQHCRVHRGQPDAGAAARHSLGAADAAGAEPGQHAHSGAAGPVPRQGR